MHLHVVIGMRLIEPSDKWLPAVVTLGERVWMCILRVCRVLQHTYIITFCRRSDCGTVLLQAWRDPEQHCCYEWGVPFWGECTPCVCQSQSQQSQNSDFILLFIFSLPLLKSSDWNWPSFLLLSHGRTAWTCTYSLPFRSHASSFTIAQIQLPRGNYCHTHLLTTP